MSQDIDPYDVVAADLVDDQCQQSGQPYCPGPDMPAQWMRDPYAADVDNTTRLVYLHPVCANQLAQDI
jgi:hypothetical protein